MFVQGRHFCHGTVAQWPIQVSKNGTLKTTLAKKGQVLTLGPVKPQSTLATRPKRRQFVPGNGAVLGDYSVSVDEALRGQSSGRVETYRLYRMLLKTVNQDIILSDRLVP